jgi:hypothetical protein
VQRKADTYRGLLHRVLSQLEQNRRSDVRSRIVPCSPRRELEQRTFRKILRPNLALLTMAALLLWLGLECAVVDLYIGNILSSNSAALKVVCGPPGIGAKI